MLTKYEYKGYDKDNHKGNVQFISAISFGRIYTKNINLNAVGVPGTTLLCYSIDSKVTGFYRFMLPLRGTREPLLNRVLIIIISNIVNDELP